jgi:hypothetical protein
MRGTAKTPEEELKQAQEILGWGLRKHGPDSAFSIRAMLDVANLLAKKGQVGEEVEMREQIVGGLRRTLGPENLGTASAEMQLAKGLITMERYEEAAPLVAHVVALRTLELGPEDPETEVAMNLSSDVMDRLS